MYSGDRSGKRLVGVWRSISRSGELIEGGAGICDCFFCYGEKSRKWVGCSLNIVQVSLDEVGHT